MHKRNATLSFYWTILFSFLCIVGNAQNTPRLLIADSTKLCHSKIVTLDEIHGVTNLPILKTELVKYLVNHNKLTDIVLEVGKAAAYLYNAYIESGDLKFLSDDLGFVRGENNKQFWRQLREYYLNGKKIEIHGIDFERMEFVQVIKLTMVNAHDTDNELYAYLNTIPDTISRLNNDFFATKANRLDILTKCKKIYNKDKARYDLIHTHENIIRDILANSVQEDKWNRRFREMENSLTDIYDLKGDFLIILGAYHIESDRPVFYGLTQKYNIADSICLISLIAKDCTTNGYGAAAAEIPFNGNDNFLRNQSFVDNSIRTYAQQCSYTLQNIDEKLISKYSIKNKNHINYIVAIDCMYTKQNCILK